MSQDEHVVVAKKRKFPFEYVPTVRRFDRDLNEVTGIPGANDCLKVKLVQDSDGRMWCEIKSRLVVDSKLARIIAGVQADWMKDANARLYKPGELKDYHIDQRTGEIRRHFGKRSVATWQGRVLDLSHGLEVIATAWMAFSYWPASNNADTATVANVLAFLRGDPVPDVGLDVGLAATDRPWQSCFADGKPGSLRKSRGKMEENRPALDRYWVTKVRDELNIKLPPKSQTKGRAMRRGSSTKAKKRRSEVVAPELDFPTIRAGLTRLISRELGRRHHEPAETLRRGIVPAVLQAGVGFIVEMSDAEAKLYRQSTK